MQVGNLLRVDGTLMGIDDKKRTLIPRWKRGHFSLLVNGGALGGLLQSVSSAAWCVSRQLAVSWVALRAVRVASGLQAQR